MFQPKLLWGIREFLYGSEAGLFVSFQFVVNILFFVPFGFLCPVSIGKRLKLFIIAVVFSGLIELLQYVTVLGMAEIDDVIANSFGAIVGYELYRILIKKDY